MTDSRFETGRSPEGAPSPGAQHELDTISSLTNRGIRAPSYAQSQYETVVRRQRIRTEANELKIPHRQLSKIASISSSSTTEGRHGHLPNTVHEWEFSGWGSVRYERIGVEEVAEARMRKEAERKRDGESSLGSWMAYGVAGVAVAGSPLYAFPALVAVAGVYSPISLLVATILLSCWRPIMEELASAIALDGANYVYLLNTAMTKDLAIFGAALTLLDDVCTSVVSAATAAAYIAGQVTLPFDVAWMTVIFIVGIAIVALLGVKGSAEAMTTILICHLITIASLAIAGVIHWATMGNGVLKENWVEGQAGSASAIAKQVFLGVCVAFLGVTGFETAPDYISSVRPGVYPNVLRSLQSIAICINSPLMLVTFAVLPMREIRSNASVLNSVADQAAGKWLRVWVSVDAVLILCATILTGVISADALIGRLAADGLFPAVFHRRLPRTGAPFVSLIFFAGLSLVIYATTGASLTIMSGVFAIAFLSIMLLFPVASLLLSFYRPFLPRAPRTSFVLNIFALLLSLALIIGNVVLAPSTSGFFAIYAIVLFFAMWFVSKRSRCMKVVWWVVDEIGWMKRLGCGERVVKWLRRLRSGPVVVFVESDEINALFEMLTYVRANEETACVKLVHCYRSVDDIPSELEANHKILDEAFPSITIDLVLLEGAFTPSLVCALSARLGVPISQCFVGSFSAEFPYALNDFGGVRIIAV